MLIMLVMGVINMSRQFFNTLVGMGSRSHDYDDDDSFWIELFFALVEYSVLYLEIWIG